MPDSFVTLWTVARQSPLSMGCPSKNMGVGCHFLLQGIFPAQRSNPCLLHWQADSLPLSRLGSPLWIIQQYSPWAVCSHYVPSTYLSCHWKLMPPLVSLLSSQRTMHVCSWTALSSCPLESKKSTASLCSIPAPVSLVQTGLIGEVRGSYLL